MANIVNILSNKRLEIKRAVRETTAWLIFPVTLLSGLGLVELLLSTNLPAGLAVFLVLAPCTVWILIFERLSPFRRSWNRGHGDTRTDVFHMLTAQIAIPRLMGPVFAALTAGTVSFASETLGVNRWPHHWPIPFQLLLMLLIAEFGRYWIHRAAHKFPLLWRLHAVHHSSNRLYWLNAGRFHPLEKILFLIPEVVPFIILGTNTETLSLYFVFNGIHGLFQHSNIHLRLGFLNYIFSMSELHRWHHSKEIDESNTNYGNNLIFWDLVFGTFYWPGDRQVKEIGLQSQDYPESFTGQMLAPFKHKG